jgi:ribosomal protein S12 methylthiotransferase accessory factor
MTDPAALLAARFRSAAAWLASDTASRGVNAEAEALSRYLDYENSDRAAAGARERLLLAAAKLRRLFQLPVPDAPGLVFFGGEADPGCLGPDCAGLPAGSLSGSGLTPQRAFEACVGEGIEYLSQFARDSDSIVTGTLAQRCGAVDDATRRYLAEVLMARDIDPGHPIGWVRVQRVPGGEDAWFPADLCLRRSEARRDFSPPGKLSTGCAAGITEDDAALRAVLELVERDAAALWWRGGRPGRAIASDSDAGLAAAALLEQLRRGDQGRSGWLLDITTDFEIPTIAAISAREDGSGFAFGLAARVHPADAARAAIFEMCQGELAHHVVAAKQRESGDTLLNDNDRLRLNYGRLIDTRHCALLRPDGESRLPPGHASAGAATGLREVLERLGRAGIEVFRLHLTRPDFQVPVVRVLAPGLQAEPGTIVGERLRRAMNSTGGGAIHTSGLPLL